MILTIIINILFQVLLFIGQRLQFRGMLLSGSEYESPNSHHSTTFCIFIISLPLFLLLSPTFLTYMVVCMCVCKIRIYFQDMLYSLVKVLKRRRERQSIRKERRQSASCFNFIFRYSALWVLRSIVYF